MRKLITMLAICIVLCCALAFSVSAATAVTDDGKNMTLGDCTIANLDGVTIPSPTRGLQYSLDEEAGTASVTGKGSFTGGALVFPSSVTYNGNTYALTKVNAGTFKSMTYDLYVPDSVTTLGGGSSNSAFNGSTISKTYIGNGLKEFELELFSGVKGRTVFVCKSKVERVGVHAFNQNTAGTGGVVEFELDLTNVVRIENNAFLQASFLSNQSIELGDCIEYIGSQAFMSSGVNGSIIIPENCVLSYRSFNGTSLEKVVIKVPKGETRALPQELFSGASGGLTVIITGDATASQNHVFSGNSMSVYMETVEQVQTLVSSASTYQGNERIEKVTFYTCQGICYTSTKTGVLSNGSTSEPHAYTDEALSLSANCTHFARTAYVCYACGNEKIVSQGTELGDHVFEEKVKAPSCQSIGYTEYDCTICELQQVGAYVEATAHDNSVKKYSLNDDKTVTVTTHCSYCGEISSTERVSLVNKCYIEGYGLFDASMEYVSVSADGTLTPANTTFDNAVIYFPSYVEVGGEAVEVKTISGFKSKSIKAIYIPDTVTRIAGGSGNGCFGDVHALKNIVIGSGVTAIERETFCMDANVYVDEFIITGTIKDIRQWAFRNLRTSSDDIPHRFVAKLEYVAFQACVSSNVLKEAYILKGCDLKEKFAFNGAEGLSRVYIEGGDTSENAIDLGQEFTSNQSTKYLYIKGYVTVSGQAVLADNDGIRVFMESKEAIDLFANAIKAQEYKGRIEKATFMDCSTGTAYYISASADAVVHPSVAFFHGGVIVETEATCTQGGTKTEKCFVCDAVVSTEETPVLEHEYDGGVITTMPNCRDLGVIVYSCLGCGQSDEFSIFRDYSTHNYEEFMTYVNGFDKAGEYGVSCTICDDITEKNTTGAIIIALGYSIRDEFGARDGINGGYSIDNDLLKKYERINGEIKLGVIIVNAGDAVTNGLVDELFKLVSKKGLQAEISERVYSAFSLSITGFSTDALKALNLLISAYVVADLDGDGVEEISYIQYTMPEKDNGVTSFGGVSLNTVSIDRACPVVSSTAYTGKDDE